MSKDELVEELREIVSFTETEKCALREIELESIRKLIAKAEAK
jgi:hypothetical protein